MNLNPFAWKKKRDLNNRLTRMIEMDRVMIMKALRKVSMATREEVIILALPAPRVIRRRVDIIGADELYAAIDESNYRSLAGSILMAQEEDEILVAMVVIDKCDEFEDYETMVMAYKHLDALLRYTKDSNATLNYARKFRNRINEYLTDQGIY
jgi:hypothetical protein